MVAVLEKRTELASDTDNRALGTIETPESRNEGSVYASPFFVHDYGLQHPEFAGCSQSLAARVRSQFL
jgi:hypothetical protein